MINVKLCRDVNIAREEVKKIGNVCAVECEYGDDLLTEKDEGIELAFYHHGDHSDNTPPCLRWDVYDKLKKPFDNFIISHVDLDTIFGIMWASKILRPTEIAKEIAELIAQQDMNGFHYMEAEVIHSLPDYLKYRFLGIGYILSRFRFTNDNSLCEDYSRTVHKAILKIKDIIIDGIDDDLKKVIDTWLIKKDEEALKIVKKYRKNLFTYFIKNGSMNPLSAYKLSIHDDFSKVNFVYNSETGIMTIACYNEKWAKKFFGENGVIDPIQKFFGITAGGRMAIGGSPRDQFITKEQADGFVDWINRNYFDKKIENEFEAQKLINKTSV